MEADSDAIFTDTKVLELMGVLDTRSRGQFDVALPAQDAGTDALTAALPKMQGGTSARWSSVSMPGRRAH